MEKWFATPSCWIIYGWWRLLIALGRKYCSMHPERGSGVWPHLDVIALSSNEGGSPDSACTDNNRGVLVPSYAILSPLLDIRISPMLLSKLTISPWFDWTDPWRWARPCNRLACPRMVITRKTVKLVQFLDGAIWWRKGFSFVSLLDRHQQKAPKTWVLFLFQLTNSGKWTWMWLAMRNATRLLNFFGHTLLKGICVLDTGRKGRMLAR